jgi:hypothetical protein
MDRSLMGMINVPLQFARIRAGISESRASSAPQAALRAQGRAWRARGAEPSRARQRPAARAVPGRAPAARATS